MIQRPDRYFLNNDLEINSWDDISSNYETLASYDLNLQEELHVFLKNWSELQAVLEENLAWRYIKMSCDTEDEQKRNAYETFVSEIQPKIAPKENELEKKLMASELIGELNEDYRVYLNKIRASIEIFREENIPLQSQLATEAQKFGAINGKMQVDYKGKEYTMQQASAAFLKSSDRNEREAVYHIISTQRKAAKEELHQLFDQLIEWRHQVAVNADFKNYRDYKFAAMSRFDYTAEDCFEFHRSIESSLMPMLNQQMDQRKKELSYEKLKPWDLMVDTKGRKALKPFESSDDLVNKTIRCFNRLDTYFGECLENMKALGHLDLESRKGKAPGGYNYPLYEIGVPFIFMNAAGTVRDLVTMVHEGGHAIHSFLSRDLKLTGFKELTSEVAELASMSMELLSMEHWDVFFENEEDLKRAKREHLEDIMGTLPWIALIDKFQHWIYENPKHSHEEREQAWLQMHSSFSSDIISWDGLAEERRILWQKQLHLFEVPFYYIEYGMAQLGAIAMWKQYKEEGNLALENYKAALKLGYTKSIPEIYEAAGIKFDFSEAYIKDLMAFVEAEYQGI